jgi:hypothetical protein
MNIATVKGMDYPYQESLTEGEFQNMQDYENSPKYGPLACGMLNKRVAYDRGIGSTPECLQTIIRNPTLHYSLPKYRRFFPKELLLAMGFPVVTRLGCPGAARPYNCTSFSSQPLMWRKRLDIMAQAGNSMQVVVCGAVWLYAIFAIELRTDTSRFAAPESQ